MSHSRPTITALENEFLLHENVESAHIGPGFYGINPKYFSILGVFLDNFKHKNMPYVTVKDDKVDPTEHITYLEGLEGYSYNNFLERYYKFHNSDISAFLKETTGSNSACRKFKCRAAHVLNTLEDMGFEVISTAGNPQQGVCRTLRKK